MASPGIDKWQAEDDCRTLQRAEEIKMDRARRVAATKVAQKQAAALQRVAKTSSTKRK